MPSTLRFPPSSLPFPHAPNQYQYTLYWAGDKRSERNCCEPRWKVYGKSLGDLRSFASSPGWDPCRQGIFGFCYLINVKTWIAMMTRQACNLRNVEIMWYPCPSHAGKDVQVLCQPQDCLCWLSPVLPSGAGSPGLAEGWAVLLFLLLPWWNCCGQGVSALSNALAPVLFRTAVGIRSTTGFHLLLHVPPLHLLPWLFGGSPGSDLRVTATFISCSLGKWCNGKRFLHPLHVTYLGIAESAPLCLDLDGGSPYSAMPLFITPGLHNGRGKNVSNVNLPCSNHKLCVRPAQWNTWD